MSLSRRLTWGGRTTLSHFTCVPATRSTHWHHRLNGHESEQTLGGSEGQGSPACLSPWGCRESDIAERLNNSLPVSSNTCSVTTGWMRRNTAPFLHGQRADASGFYIKALFLNIKSLSLAKYILKSKSELSSLVMKLWVVWNHLSDDAILSPHFEEIELSE